MPIEERLVRLDIKIPKAPSLPANCVPYTVHNDLIFVSGQVAFDNGRVLHCGIVPDAVSIEEAQIAAKQCTLNLIAVLNEACNGDLNRLCQCLRIEGFVRCTDTFVQQPKVIDAASDLITNIFGENGRHSRMAIGVNALPLNASVEIAGIFSVNNG